MESLHAQAAPGKGGADVAVGGGSTGDPDQKVTSLVAVVCAQRLGIAPQALAEVLRPYAECPIGAWSTLGRHDPTTATWMSAALASGCLPGLVHPRLVQERFRTTAYRDVAGRVNARFGEAELLGSILAGITRLVPWPGDLDAVAAVLELADAAPGARTRRALLEVLCDKEEPVVLGGVEHSPAALTRQIAAEGATGPSPLAERLAGDDRCQLPGWLARLCALAGRSERGSKSAPIRLVARLPEPVGLLASLLPDLLGSRPANWAAIRPVMTHLERLGRVLGLVDPPTLWPRAHALGRLHLDQEAALAYDRCLADEVGALLDGEEAVKDPFGRVLRGFGLFCELLSFAAERGARIEALPRGVKAPRRAERYQGLRPDLTPSAQLYRTYLAELPALVRAEDRAIARLVVIGALTPLRHHAVLTLERRAWIAEGDWVIVYVRPDALHKVGRALVLLPEGLRALYGAEPTWLPETTPPVPPALLTSAYDTVLERVRERFFQRTGLVLPGGLYAARRGLVQLLRQRLSFPELGLLTAYLGHRSPGSRSAYERVTTGEMATLRRRLAELSRG